MQNHSSGMVHHLTDSEPAFFAAIGLIRDSRRDRDLYHALVVCDSLASRLPWILR
jgi:hypothetical protein